MSFTEYRKRLFEAKELKAETDYDKYTIAALETVLKKVMASAKSWFTENWSRRNSEIEKMNEYKNKGSNPVRLATSTRDLMKVVSRMVWCETNWPEAVEAYKLRAYELIMEDPFYKDSIDEIVSDKKEIEKQAKEFEEQVNNSNTDKFAPTERDWQKMIDYLNKKSDPERLAKSCKDPNKVVARFIIANALNWKEAATEFRFRAIELGIATKAELEAYARKYRDYNVPADWQEYIDMLKQDDVKGGLAKQNEDKIDIRLTKVLDNIIEVADYSKYEVNNCNTACVKITRYDSPDMYIFYMFNVDRWTSTYYGIRNHGKYIHYYVEYGLMLEDPNSIQGQETVKDKVEPRSNRFWHRCETQDVFKNSLRYNIENFKG